MAVESPPRLPCSLHIPDCPHLHIDLAPPIHKKELDAQVELVASRTFFRGYAVLPPSSVATLPLKDANRPH